MGAFWQPRLVLVDTETLETLPPAFFTDGVGEIVKYACIRDTALFEALEAGTALDAAHREETVLRCIDCKRGVVERDEREAGERKLLNFGHTLGHALERYYHYEGAYPRLRRGDRHGPYHRGVGGPGPDSARYAPASVGGIGALRPSLPRTRRTMPLCFPAWGWIKSATARPSTW